jgi:hypothetical protein
VPQKGVTEPPTCVIITSASTLITSMAPFNHPRSMTEVVAIQALFGVLVFPALEKHLDRIIFFCA